MHEIVTARLDESYTHLLTGEHVNCERQVAFEVVAPPDCNHSNGDTICTECAPGWQLDYDFADPFPFPRVTRTTVADLLAARMLTAGTTLVMDKDTATTAVVTATGGLMLADGRVFNNPSAAANAALHP